MIFFQKFTKTILSLTILISAVACVDREIFKGDPIAQGIVGGVEIVARAVDPRQLVCLAENVYHEAGSESQAGKAAVARVVMNRVAHGFGKNPCAVVNQKTVVATAEGEQRTVCQFSWQCEGAAKPNKNDPRYQQSERIAYQVLAYDAYNDVVSKSALFFHNTSVDPNWPYKREKTIGNHVFYSKHKRNNSKAK